MAKNILNNKTVLVILFQQPQPVTTFIHKTTCMLI